MKIRIWTRQAGLASQVTYWATRLGRLCSANQKLSLSNACNYRKILRLTKNILKNEYSHSVFQYFGQRPFSGKETSVSFLEKGRWPKYWKTEWLYLFYLSVEFPTELFVLIFLRMVCEFLHVFLSRNTLKTCIYSKFPHIQITVLKEESDQVCTKKKIFEQLVLLCSIQTFRQLLISYKPLTLMPLVPQKYDVIMFSNSCWIIRLPHSTAFWRAKDI